MIVYEVSLQVEAAIADAYLAWLRPHIAELLALPGFAGAELLRLDEPLEPGWVGWVVVYRLHDRAALERYLAEDAPRLRGDGLARFGTRFRASRRILSPVDAGAR